MAAQDVAPALLEAVREAFERDMKQDKELVRLLERISEGKASFEDAGEYAARVGEALAAAFGECLSSEVLPEGRMWYNIAERVVKPMLEEDHQLVTTAAAETITALNRGAEIGMTAQTLPADGERIQGFLDRLSSEPVYDDVAWMLDAPVVSFSQAAATETLKQSVRVMGKSGLRARIIRRAERRCCKWCSALAGTYDYPDVPDDVYRRHENCRCVVEYDPGEGKKRQNVHSKEWQDAEAPDELEARRQLTGIGEGNQPNRILELNQKNRGKKVMITDQAIQKVRAVSFDRIDEATASFIQATHQELLRFSRAENFSDEVVCAIDLRSNTRLHFIKGSRDTVDPEADAQYYHALHTAPQKSLVICHNHPGLSYFSLNDIAFFMSYDSVKTMTIVTNQGHVWYISKTSAFNRRTAADCMVDATKKFPDDLDSRVEYFIKNCYTYGVERN